jgi:tRNA1Val (adenine37-N6)-methyltransferase
MPNNYFQFKQFRIEQGQSAMKVTTEACLFGAWVANLDLQPTRMLDIGTGTGLLALMLAQRVDCPIDAIELDENAATQASTNFKESTWSERLNLIHGDVREYAGKSIDRYDLVFSNPPFYAHHLLSGKAKDKALHQETLSQQELLDAADRLLTEEGLLAVLYPVYESAKFEKLAKTKRLYRQYRLSIQDSPGRPRMREVCLYSRRQSTIIEEDITIKTSSGEYTNEYKELLKGYYLGL